MSHNLQHRNGIDCFAFVGEQAWHKLGQRMQPGATKAEWRAASGHDFEVEKVPLVAAYGEAGLDHLPAFKETEFFGLARKDDGHMFASVTKTYQPVQPAVLDDFFDAYIAHDPRFQLDAMGALGDGERIWTTAKFADDLTVAGDRIIPRLLMSTSYDATMATRAEATTTRVVCQNTLRAAYASDKAVIKVSHRVVWNEHTAKRVRAELEQIVASYSEFKRMGDAMARCSLTEQETATFVRNLLDIPLEAKRDDVSTKMQNIVGELQTAINVTLRERNTRDVDAWCVLNGVTRYVDHDRSVRTDNGARSVEAARFDAATFGAGDSLKGKAVQLLMPIVKARAFA